MPFFSYPAPADWLLPLIKIPLGLASLLFSGLELIGLWGSVAVCLIVIAIFTRNIMGPHRV